MSQSMHCRIWILFTFLELVEALPLYRRSSNWHSYAHIYYGKAWKWQIPGPHTVQGEDFSKVRNLHASNTCDDETQLLKKDESVIRNLASNALINVFYDFDKKNGFSRNSRKIGTEKALKTSLRQLQTILGDNMIQGQDAIEYRTKLRKRLSELILGTSVMRLSLWYNVMMNKNKEDRAFLTQYPIQGAEELITHFFIFDIDPLDKVMLEHKIGKPIESVLMDLIREMIDYHAECVEFDESKQTHQAKYNHLNNILDKCTSFEKNESLKEIEAIELSIRQSLPPFLSRLLIEQYGLDVCAKLAQVSNSRGPITLRRNAINCLSNEELCHRLLKEENIQTKPMYQNKESFNNIESAIRISSERPRSIWNINAWKDGQFEVQDLGSQLIVKAMQLDFFLLQNDDGNRVIVDFCAGNGGKTFGIAGSIASILREKSKVLCNVRIIAHDIIPDRIKQIEGSMDRVGFKNGVFVYGKEDRRFISLDTTTNVTSISMASADVVLVDAPCSSLGVLRRRPSQRWMLTENQIRQEFPTLQLNILNEASQLVKVGGGLVYATCSISKYENENVAKAFESYSSFSDNWEPWNFQDIDTSSQNRNWRAILPHVDDSDGFFIARWKRKHVKNTNC